MSTAVVHRGRRAAQARRPPPVPHAAAQGGLRGLARVIGGLLALYLVIGRWSFSRLEGSFELAPAYEQPRVWVLLLALALVLNLAAGAKSVAAGGQRVAAGWRPHPVDLSILGFLLLVLASAFWASDVSLATQKAFEVTLLVLASAVVCLARHGTLVEEVAVGFWWALLLIGLALGGLALAMSSGGRVYAPGGGPNTFGRNMCLMALAAVYLASRPGTPPTSKLLAAGAAVMGAMLVLMCGSRGGFFSSALAALTFLATSRAGLPKKIAATAVVSALGGFALFRTAAGGNALEVFNHRIMDQTIGQGYMAGRDDLWMRAYELGMERFWFGWGLNGFQANSWVYPHNLFLEVWVEAGVVGLLTLLFVLARWASHYWVNRTATPRAALAALVLTLAAAQTSGDIYDSRGVFLLLAFTLPTAPMPARRPKLSRATRRPARRPALARAGSP